MGNGMAASGAGDLNATDDAQAKLSVLEVDSLEDFIKRAELADKTFESERERFVVLDDQGVEYEQNRINEFGADGITRDTTIDANAFTFEELSIPRRPKWDASTTKEELDRDEKDSFLEWRRNIAHMEEKRGNGSVTPFEKNLEIWKQLWRVLERSSIVTQIVDARNPLFYLSPDLRKYAENELGKPMLVVINKSDYLSPRQRQLWHEHLLSMNIHHVFFSAYDEQKRLDDAVHAEIQITKIGELPGDEFEQVTDSESEEEESSDEENSGDETTATTKKPEYKTQLQMDKEEAALAMKNAEEELAKFHAPEAERAEADKFGVRNLLTRNELLDYLEKFAVDNGCEPNPRWGDKNQFGFVGFPNVGKSSVINVLVGSSKHAHGFVRVAVAAQPGKTKHFQTLMIRDRPIMMLCDCPGLVFPSFVSSTADMIAAGVYPIAQMRNHWPVVGLICQRIPRELLNAYYGFKIPLSRPKGWVKGEPDPLMGEGPIPAPSAEELLTTFCLARSILAAGSGVCDHQRASRVVVEDYVTGKLLHCHPPPSIENSGSEEEKLYHQESVSTCLVRNSKLKGLVDDAESKRLNAGGKAKLAWGENSAEKGYTYDERSFVTDAGSLTSVVEKENEDENGEDDDEAAIIVDGEETTSNSMQMPDNSKELEFDMDMLDLLGGEVEEVENGGKRGKAHKTMKGWGKKGRKLRNNDPYGCHTDKTLNVLNQSGTTGGTGVHTSAGKYGSAGYVRPNYTEGSKSGVGFKDTRKEGKDAVPFNRKQGKIS